MSIETKKIKREEKFQKEYDKGPLLIKIQACPRTGRTKPCSEECRNECLEVAKKLSLKGIKLSSSVISMNQIYYDEIPSTKTSSKIGNVEASNFLLDQESKISNRESKITYQESKISVENVKELPKVKKKRSVVKKYPSIIEERVINIPKICTPLSKSPYYTPNDFTILPRYHGPRCALEVCIMEKHHHNCPLHKDQDNTQETVEEYKVVERFVHLTCQQAWKGSFHDVRPKNKGDTPYIDSKTDTTAGYPTLTTPPTKLTSKDRISQDLSEPSTYVDTDETRLSGIDSLPDIKPLATPCTEPQKEKESLCSCIRLSPSQCIKFISTGQQTLGVFEADRGDKEDKSVGSEYSSESSQLSATLTDSIKNMLKVMIDQLLRDKLGYSSTQSSKRDESTKSNVVLDKEMEQSIRVLLNRIIDEMLSIKESSIDEKEKIMSFSKLSVSNSGRSSKNKVTPESKIANMVEKKLLDKQKAWQPSKKLLSPSEEKMIKTLIENILERVYLQTKAYDVSHPKSGIARLKSLPEKSITSEDISKRLSSSQESTESMITFLKPPSLRIGSEERMKRLELIKEDFRKPSFFKTARRSKIGVKTPPSRKSKSESDEKVMTKTSEIKDSEKVPSPKTFRKSKINITSEYDVNEDDDTSLEYVQNIIERILENVLREKLKPDFLSDDESASSSQNKKLKNKSPTESIAVESRTSEIILYAMTNLLPKLGALLAPLAKTTIFDNIEKKDKYSLSTILKPMKQSANKLKQFKDNTENDEELVKTGSSLYNKQSGDILTIAKRKRFSYLRGLVGKKSKKRNVKIKQTIPGKSIKKDPPDAEESFKSILRRKTERSVTRILDELLNKLPSTAALNLLMNQDGQKYHGRNKERGAIFKMVANLFKKKHFHAIDDTEDKILISSNRLKNVIEDLKLYEPSTSKQEKSVSKNPMFNKDKICHHSISSSSISSSTDGKKSGIIVIKSPVESDLTLENVRSNFINKANKSRESNRKYSAVEDSVTMTRSRSTHSHSDKATKHQLSRKQK